MTVSVTLDDCVLNFHSIILFSEIACAPLICSMEYYMQKTYYKTASLISNSCKAIALLAGQTTEVAVLAFEYGKNLVCELLEFLFVMLRRKLNSGT